ncbi:unnamed protein product [Rhizoctonia solani]|uniref:Uncharacterized protein n=1 Tax=Rhizoctonia solani TaxID=456999 RepID=A0A8H3C7L7_9AGAM|nr:unnamed protein product [Rhizoctonia solani]
MTEPTTLKSGRIRARDPSPARSDSSISLGTHWYSSPKKKRTWRRKRPSATEEGKPAVPRKRYNRKRGQQRVTTQTSRDEHITTARLDPVPPLAAPIAVDVQPRPSTSPFKSRARLPSAAPRIRINLESARLETIQAQESARGYDIYHHWPTPPGSGSVKSRVGNALNTPTTSSSPEQRTHLYAPNDVGSSTGPETREHDKLHGEPRWTPWASVSAPQKLGVSLKDTTLLTPLTTDRPYTSFAEPLEMKLGIVDPELIKLAQLGLQTRLRDLVEQYDYPLEKVSKLYRSNGCLEETERVLKQLRSKQDELRVMTKAAFGVE